MKGLVNITMFKIGDVINYGRYKECLIVAVENKNYTLRKGCTEGRFCKKLVEENAKLTKVNTSYCKRINCENYYPHIDECKICNMLECRKFQLGK